jgi:purine-binding chemotaxis protein CheW
MGDHKHVCFFLNGREFAVPIDEVRETVEMRPITPVFRTPPSLAGICNLRGEILAVIDPAPLLGLPPNRLERGGRIVIVEPDERAAGLIVDRLGPVRLFHDEDVVAPPATVAPAVAAMLAGVVSAADRPVGVLDVKRLFAAPELAPFVRAPRSAEGASTES